MGPPRKMWEDKMGGRTGALGLSGLLGGNNLPASPYQYGWHGTPGQRQRQKGCEADPRAPDATWSLPLYLQCLKEA